MRYIFALHFILYSLLECLETHQKCRANEPCLPAINSNFVEHDVCTQMRLSPSSLIFLVLFYLCNLPGESKLLKQRPGRLHQSHSTALQSIFSLLWRGRLFLEIRYVFANFETHQKCRTNGPCLPSFHELEFQWTWCLHANSSFHDSVIFQVNPNCWNNVLDDCTNPIQRPFKASPLFSDEEDLFWRSGMCSRILKHTKSAEPTDPAFWPIFYKQIRAFMNFNLPGSHLSSEQRQDIKLDIRPKVDDQECDKLLK
jgi:hypothetical protein